MFGKPMQNGRSPSSPGERLIADPQHQSFEDSSNACGPRLHIAEMVERGWSSITHGNGPQVGFCLLSSRWPAASSTDPMEVCVADTQGSWGT